MREFITGRVEVGSDEPVLVCTVAQDIQFVTVRNVGETTVYLGGAQVISEPSDDLGHNVGFPLDPGEIHDIPAYDSDAVNLWAIAAPETVAVVSFLVSSGGDGKPFLR